MDRRVRTLTGLDAHEAAEIFALQFPAMYLRFHRRDAKGTTLPRRPGPPSSTLRSPGRSRLASCAATSTGPNRS